ncbi:Transcription factor FapR [bacterium HR19]|nr:Transcription factor FapR [bacterium HR19]
MGKRKVDQRTHLLASRSYCGKVISISEKSSSVELKTKKTMVVDERGLVHGGFTFSLADYSAMLAVNHPYVVLYKADVKFIKPVVLGDTLLARAQVISEDGSKKEVFVEVFKKGTDEKVFEGKFLCVVLDRHVLDRK